MQLFGYIWVPWSFQVVQAGIAKARAHQNTSSMLEPHTSHNKSVS